jgi:hypothetical protein
MFKLNPAQANNVLRFNWPAAYDDETFIAEYGADATETDERLWNVLTSSRDLSPALVAALALDMDLIISRAEDAYDTSLFCGERGDAIGDYSVLRSMQALQRRINRYLKMIAPAK